MIKLFYTILLMLSLTSVGFTEEEFNSEIPQSGDNPQAFPSVETTNNDVLNRALFNYRQGAYLLYNNASSLTIGPGEVACNSNTGATNGQTIIYRLTTANITATTVNLDTGSSFANSTTYYVYANCDAAATTFTITLSLNSTTPSGVTNYKQLGNFTTDSSANISQIIDSLVVSHYGAPVSVSCGASIQAHTDGTLYVYDKFAATSQASIAIGVNSPSTTMAIWGGGNNSFNQYFSLSSKVPKGYYYEYSSNAGSYGNCVANFIPSGQ